MMATPIDYVNSLRSRQGHLRGKQEGKTKLLFAYFIQKSTIIYTKHLHHHQPKSLFTGLVALMRLIVMIGMNLFR